MRKLSISLLLIMIVACQGFAQGSLSAPTRLGTYSPYSIYGIGQMRLSGNGETIAMGGAGTAYSSSLVLNTQNPAALSTLGFTVYTLGATFEAVSYKDARAGHGTSTTVYLNHLMIGLPIYKKNGVPKLGLTLGVTPYSVVGYSIVDTLRNNTLPPNGSSNAGRIEVNTFEGIGGLNRVFIGAGYRLVKNLSIGVEASYVFGTIHRSTFNQTEGVLLGTEYYAKNEMRGFDFKGGLLYNFKLKDDLRAYLGATYSISSGMKDLQSIELYTINPDYENGTLIRQTNDTIRFSLPQTFSVGVGMGNIYKWFFGAQYEYVQKPDYEKVDLSGESAVYRAQNNASLGASWTPDYISPNSYMKRVNYRMGAYYRQTGIRLNDTNVNDIGVTLGAGFPLTKMAAQSGVASAINFYLNYGQTGTTKNGLVRESYFKIGLSFSLNDLWFRKVNYN